MDTYKPVGIAPRAYFAAFPMTGQVGGGDLQAGVAGVDGRHTRTSGSAVAKYHKEPRLAGNDCAAGDEPGWQAGRPLAQYRCRAAQGPSRRYLVSGPRKTAPVTITSCPSAGPFADGVVTFNGALQEDGIIKQAQATGPSLITSVTTMMWSPTPEDGRVLQRILSTAGGGARDVQLGLHQHRRQPLMTTRTPTPEAGCNVYPPYAGEFGGGGRGFDGLGRGASGIDDYKYVTTHAGRRLPRAGGLRFAGGTPGSGGWAGGPG